MKSTPETYDTRRGETDCLARSVVDTLGEEPALEAVTIDAARQTISVATLGRVPQGGMEKLTERLSSKFQSAQGADPKHACTLLSGGNDCAVCGSPLSQIERKRITIQHSGEVTTIARVTCPTAPKFWRWRDLPFPKIVPREIEIHDDEHAVDEWKMQMVAAILCGVFGLAGWTAGYFLPAPFRILFFVAAYLAGGFYPAE
ncbi:MAG TPA: cation-transporting P-type ATPase, partial [Verrucomicrobiae bacterium]